MNRKSKSCSAVLPLFAVTIHWCDASHQPIVQIALDVRLSIDFVSRTQRTSRASAETRPRHQPGEARPCCSSGRVMNIKKPGRVNALTEIEDHSSDASRLISNGSDRACRDPPQAH